jgi:hypothetical protein
VKAREYGGGIDAAQTAHMFVFSDALFAYTLNASCIYVCVSDPRQHTMKQSFLTRSRTRTQNTNARMHARTHLCHIQLSAVGELFGDSTLLITLLKGASSLLVPLAHRPASRQRISIFAV